MTRSSEGTESSQGTEASSADAPDAGSRGDAQAELFPAGTVAPAELELSIVIPCLDEAETLGSCIDKARGFLERHAVRGEVVVHRGNAAAPSCTLTIEDAPWPLGGPFQISSVVHRISAEVATTSVGFFSNSLPKADG